MQADRSNFEALRLFACGLLVYGNGLILTGAPAAGLWGAPLPRVGLDLLFATGGFLLARAWIGTGSLSAYCRGCALRLFPGLAASVLVTVFIIGPLATKLSIRFYFLNGLTVRYLLNIALFPHYWLPRVFEGQQWAGAVNGVLWVLPAGALCVLLVPALRPGAALLVAVLSACGAVALTILGAGGPDTVFGVSVGGLLTEIPFFLGGAVLAWLERRSGDAIWRADLAMMFFAANWVFATWAAEWDLILEWLTLPYMACCFGRGAVPVLGRIPRIGKPSYGMFLYAFPIQQLLVARAPELAHPILICVLSSFAAGLLSWHVIERPALDWGARAVMRQRLAFGPKREAAG